MKTVFAPAMRLFLALSLITGLLYPLVSYVIGQALFPHEANGSLLKDNDHIIGSELIGQTFDAPNYFWSRPSATSPAYNAAASSGSNLGPLNPALTTAINERVATLKKADPQNTAAIPVDLITASASGLDPHISPAAAIYQINRVANARNLPAEKVQQLVNDSIEPRQWRLFGEPRVNVLRLNLALEKLR